MKKTILCEINAELYNLNHLDKKETITRIQ